MFRVGHRLDNNPTRNLNTGSVFIQQGFARKEGGYLVTLLDEGLYVLVNFACGDGGCSLSDSIIFTNSNDRDGTNVTLHEFAHLLDMESGAADGTPILQDHEHYSEWAKVFEAEFKHLRRASRRGRSMVLDEYGAEHPAEFFAVATEAFFENPSEMKQRHPALYGELKVYYQQDPVTWLSRSDVV